MRLRQAKCSSGSSARGGSTLVEYHHAAGPDPDLTVINDNNRGQLAKASALVDYHKADFAGTYVDQRSQVVVVAVTDHGETLAKKRLGVDPVVTIEHGSLSLDTANRLGVDLIRGVPAVGDKMWMSAIDPAASALRIGLSRRPATTTGRLSSSSRASTRYTSVMNPPPVASAAWPTFSSGRTRLASHPNRAAAAPIEANSIG
jgi:hypothetical protein